MSTIHAWKIQFSGVVQCFLAEGKKEDAAAQMEFVKATYPEITKTSVCFFK